MRKVLISSFDMQVGGVERSLVSMLNNFNYNENDVDLMLYSHEGDFLPLINDKVNLLNEIEEYSNFRKSIATILKEKHLTICFFRIIAKLYGNMKARKTKGESVHQMQYMWKLLMSYLPTLDDKYDVAISYLWPHYFIAEKVKANKKIAWIHTDYSNIETDVEEDLRIWNKFDYICAVSEECKNSFLKKYPSLNYKIIVIENITSPEFITLMSKENIEEDIYKKNYFNLLSVARLSYAKGIDDGVRALKILHNKGLTNIKWYVVGYGGDEELIKRLIKENGLEDSFILLGKKTNPYPYMKSCNLYVQPSRYEGKAVTVGEAQILGRPVLITNYSTAKSQVKHNIDGYITDMGPLGIADGIEKLYKDEKLRVRLSKYCKEHDFGNSNELEKLYSLF